MKKFILLTVITALVFGCSNNESTKTKSSENKNESPRMANQQAALIDSLENVALEFLHCWEPPFYPEEAISLFTKSSDFNLVIDGYRIDSYEEWARNVPNFMADDNYFFTSYKHEVLDFKTLILSEQSGVTTINYIWDSVSKDGTHERTPGVATLICRLEDSSWKIVQYHGSHGQAEIID